ncbi:hypothetical protein [Bibersteinia trehalosi]|uniref:hypothetical protein n=1 Tax=Bibersteinia trehalosi TaxID=47735 RepID=UPI004045BE0F
MLVSDQFWFKFIENKSEFKEWKTWLNKHGANGQQIDFDDYTSYLNPERTKAVKISFEPEMDEVYFDYESQFGDEIMGYIDMLNILFNDLDKAQEPFEKRFNEWLNK